MTSNLGADALLELERSEKRQKREEKELERLELSGASASASASASGSVRTSANAADIKSEMKKKQERKRLLALGLVQRHFSSEFVNRLDEVVVFNPLSEKAMRAICQIELGKVITLCFDMFCIYMIDGLLFRYLL
jgi:ATP-dependent Clp protease ATP-binding subunit ClpA